MLMASMQAAAENWGVTVAQCKLWRLGVRGQQVISAYPVVARALVRYRGNLW